MNIPITDPDKIWELRLYLGDLGDLAMGDDQYLSDEAYQFIINKYTKPNPPPDGTYQFRKALIAAAMSILALLAHSGARQRVGQEDIYGKELVDSWLAFLKLLQKGKYTGASPVVYFGGVYRDMTAYYATHPNMIDPPFYRGQQDRSPYWKYKRKEFLKFVQEPEESKANGIWLSQE